LLYNRFVFRNHSGQVFERTTFPLWQRAAFFSLAYFFCAWLGRFLSPGGGTAVSYWLPGGLSVAVLLRNPTRDWPWLLLAIVPANSLFDLLHDPNPNFAVIFLFCVANIIQAGLGAWLVRRFVAEQPVLASLPEFFGLMFFAGILGSAVGATIGATMLKSFHLAGSFVDSWKTLWGGNVMAVLVLAPLILTFGAGEERPAARPFTLLRASEGLLVYGGLMIFTWYLLVPGGGINSPKIPVLIFILWAGVRFGLRWAAAAIFLLAVLAAFLTTHYLTMIPASEIRSGGYVFTLQVFVAVSAMVGLVPAIVLGERNRTMAKLRDSEIRFRTLNDAAFEGVCISENGIMVDVNDQALKMFGYPRDEMIGKKILELVAPESRATVAEAIRSGREVIYGHSTLRKDGTIFYAEAQARLVRVGDRTLRMTAVRDITERKLAEQALHESEEKFSKAFRASPDGLAISELETGRYIELNDGYCKLYGYRREEMLGRTSVELGIWENVADRARLVEGLKTAGGVRNFEIRTRHRSGETRIIQLSAEAIELRGKSCLVSALHDVTDRRLAEQALHASEQSLRATIENTPHVAVQWFDRRGRVTFWNPASELMYGWPAAAALGKTLAELIFTPEQNAAFLQVIAGIEADGQPFGPAEFPFHHRDGSRGVILSTVFQIQIPSGERRFVCMDVDLTRRKQAENLSDAQRQVLEMIAGGQPVKPTLDALLRMIENQAPDMLCSILLLDPDGMRVRHGAAPSLPAEFIQAIDGSAIGPCAGSCGTAAFRREPVFVADIASDPLWVDYKKIALVHGLRACWSTPIFDGQRKVLGTFAVYYRQPGLPHERHRQLISMATHTAAICLGKHRTETEREQAVAREQQARIEYTLQLIAAQEAERKRIASELHDSLGQNLLLIKNRAQLVLTQGNIAGEPKEQLEGISQLASACIAEARQISRDLHPPQLDHLGLTRALKAMIENTSQSCAIRFTSKIELVDDLFSPDAAMSLYRVVQESLNNILKHSQAKRVEIRLERDIHEVQLRIEDDGCGFKLDRTAQAKGLGLKNITERVRMLGGRLQLDSKPGRGMRLEVTVPLVEKTV
jgi:PAS domain S-box-containing protein